MRHHRSTLRRAVALFGMSLLLTVPPVDARMYQWVDPGLRSTQLSGTPPSWYRSREGGPRVRVFENGNLVDDTAIALPPSQAQELRDEAFAEYEQRQREETLRQLERAAARDLRRQEEAQRVAQRQREAGEPTAGTPQQTDQASASGGTTFTVDPNDPTPEAVQRLKAMIDEFDKRSRELLKN